jgi:hypothetical protein
LHFRKFINRFSLICLLSTYSYRIQKAWFTIA